MISAPLEKFKVAFEIYTGIYKYIQNIPDESEVFE